MKDLSTGKPGKLILMFALPVALGNIFQLCYSFADVWIVGSTLGNNALAAVGSTSTLNDLIVGFLIGLTNGFAVITAQKFGAKDYDQMRRTVAHTVMLGFAVSVLLTLFSTGFLDTILGWLNIPPEHFENARAYSRVILLGMTFSMTYNICASTLRAVGDTVTPLVFLILSAVINVILDFVFIRIAGTGVEGAAYATVISQLISAVCCIIYMYVRYPLLHMKGNDFKPSGILVKSLFSCGLSMGLMNSLVAFGTVALQSAINTLGTNIIVAHTAARKLTSLFMMPFGVMGMTMSAYCAQNYGAKKYSRIRKGVFEAVKFCWIWCAALFIVIYTVVSPVLRLITSTDVPEIIDTATIYLRINCILYFVTAVISVFRNSLQGIGVHRTPIVSSGIELAGKILIARFLTPAIGYWGIIISEPVIWVVMVIPLIVRLLGHPAMKPRTDDSTESVC